MEGLKFIILGFLIVFSAIGAIILGTAGILSLLEKHYRLKEYYVYVVFFKVTIIILGIIYLIL